MPLQSKHGRVHICLEAGATHSGLHSAIRLVDAVGGYIPFDSWKWQTIRADDLVGQDYEITYVDGGGEQTESIKKVLRRREMGTNDWVGLFKRIRNHWGYDFFSTPDTEEIVEFLLRIGSSAIKIMGADMTHLKLIKAAATTKLPVLLDARCTFEELERAVSVCYDADNVDVTIVHCPPGYPASADNVYLNEIRGLQEVFPLCQIGFSDHSPGYDMCVAAVALGATYIEKTVTLGRHAPGPEHIMSLEPYEVPEFVEAIREVEKAVVQSYGVLPAPNTQHRRSIFLTRDKQAGNIIQEADLDYKRPGNIGGIGAEEYNEVIGQWFQRNVKKGDLLRPIDVGMKETAGELE